MAPGPCCTDSRRCDVLGGLYGKKRDQRFTTCHTDTHRPPGAKLIGFASFTTPTSDAKQLWGGECVRGGVRSDSVARSGSGHGPVPGRRPGVDDLFLKRILVHS